MILIHEVARTTDYISVYRDSSDAKLFYYIPQFAEVARRNDGRLNFGAILFRRNPQDPNDGFSLYNFGVRGVYPSAELSRVRQELEQQYGSGVALQPINPSVSSPKLTPLTEGIYRSIRCQSNGGNLYTDLGCSFTLDETLEPDFARAVQSSTVGWAGEISYRILTKRTTFEWRITANWKAVHEHFRSQLSVKWWFVSANLSYEVQRLTENGVIDVDVTGGSPDQREKVFAIAEAIGGRMFKRSLQPNPLPAHPSGAVVCFSLNYSAVFEDRRETWAGRVSDFEEKDLGMAAYVRDVPATYFSGFPDSGPESSSATRRMVDLDLLDSHAA